MSSALPAILVMVAALALSAAVVPLSRALARKLGVMDQPGPRKVHAAPMPRLGGLAVFLSFSGVVLAGYALVPFLNALPFVQTHFGTPLALLQEAYRVEKKLLALLVSSALVFGVGLADDILGTRFPVGWKAAGQVVAALVVIAADVRTSFMPYDWLNTAITLLWVVGVTNAFNLLDNMDGLCTGVAFVASAVLLINAWMLGEFFISLILVAFMGSLLGFLLFNFNPASVFLGDCGSLFIGSVLASLTLLERYVSHASSTYFPVLMPVLVLAVPLLDTATVIVIRLRERRPIYVGDSRHLSHRLVSLGLSQRTAVLIIYLITFCLGLGAASLADATPMETLLILVQSASFVALILILLFFERRSEKRKPAPRGAA
ncbi:MAG TPA: MraY family glycosyltransferase [Vicinamibacteria bacterium]|nr:MraY family glycosyltransferase [Vicinamibacteria bacterium]